MSNTNKILKKIYVLYPELDDPVIFPSEKEAKKTKRAWRKADLSWAKYPDDVDDVLGPFEYVLNDK